MACVEVQIHTLLDNCLSASVASNERPAPDDLLESFPIPSTDGIKYHEGAVRHNGVEGDEDKDFK